MSLRILFVLAYYAPYIGGAERMFQALAEGLAERGHRVQVLTTRLPDTADHERLNGVDIQRVRTPRRADRYFFTALAAPHARRLAASCDLVHTTPYNGAPPAVWAARRAGVPVVYTVLEVLGERWHSVERRVWKAAGYRALERIVNRLPYDAVAAISQATLRDWRALGPRREQGRVVYCGVDEAFTPDEPSGLLRQRCGIPEDAFLVVYYGRPGITKGVRHLLEAAPLIEAAIPSARLVLIMPDEPRAWYEEWRALAARLAGRAHIQLVPSFSDRRDLVAHLRDASCIVVPSLTEGFGMTAAEACALGVPLVATRAGSIPEVVSGRHVLVEPGSAQALCRGVVRASRGDFDPSPEPRRFSWSAMIDGYESLYDELLGRVPTLAARTNLAS